MEEDKNKYFQDHMYAYEGLSKDAEGSADNPDGKVPIQEEFPTEFEEVMAIVKQGLAVVGSWPKKILPYFKLPKRKPKEEKVKKVYASPVYEPESTPKAKAKPAPASQEKVYQGPVYNFDPKQKKKKPVKSGIDWPTQFGIICGFIAVLILVLIAGYYDNTQDDATPEVQEAAVEIVEPEDETDGAYSFKEVNASMQATGDLNVRNLPCVDGQIIGVIRKGDVILAEKVCNETGWYRFTYKDQTGYVSGKYMQEYEE